MLGWTGGNWHWNIATGVNVSIGEWEQGSFVNLGFNRWAVDVTGSATYLDMTTGLEASAASGPAFGLILPMSDRAALASSHGKFALSGMTDTSNLEQNILMFSIMTMVFLPCHAFRSIKELVPDIGLNGFWAEPSSAR